MNSVPNHEFMELHQHQPHCKQQCFMFAEMADIELPPEVMRYPDMKLKHGAAHLYLSESSVPAVLAAKTNLHHSRSKGSGSSAGGIGGGGGNSRTARCLVTVLGSVLVFVALAAGIPLALQLRASSLLEARLSFIRRLLSESPLVDGYWSPRRDSNFSYNIAEVKESMVGAVLWPITVPCGAQYLDAVQLALEGIDDAMRISAMNSGLKIVHSAEELEDENERGHIAVLMGLQGGHTLGASLGVLRAMHFLGVRFVSLTGLGCATPWVSAAPTTDYPYLLEDNQTKSLTRFGQSVISEMNRMGMLAEVSRLSDEAIIAALRVAKAPVLFANSAALAKCNSTSVAAIPDHILRILPHNGGVLLVNVEKCGDRFLTVKEAINGINYVRKITGVDHVGLSGSPKNYPWLLAELARDRIWGNAAIKKLVGGNIVRVLKEVEHLKGRVAVSENMIPKEEIDANAYCQYPET